MITDKGVKNAKAGTHTAGDNLYLRVSARGTKTFIARLRHNGKDKWATLGHYPTMTLAEARDKSESLCAQIRSGVVPATQITVGEVARQYMLALDYRRPEQVQRIIDVELLPHAKHTLVTAWKRAAIMALMQDIVDRGAPVMANRVFLVVKAMLTFAEHKGWIEANPVGTVTRKYVGGKENSKSRALSWEEISDLLRRSMSPPTKHALCFILLTGLRPSEALWVLRHTKTEGIPTKTEPHRIPATPLIRAMIKLAPPPPKDHRVLSHALRRLSLPYTPHDLRRTFSTRLSDLGVMPHVIEKQLNHHMEGSMAIYNHAEYWPERDAALRLWARKLHELRKKPPGANRG